MHLYVFVRVDNQFKFKYIRVNSADAHHILSLKKF